MADLGTLNIQVDSSSVPAATASLKGLAAASTDAQASTDALQVKQESLAQSIDRQTASQIRNSPATRLSAADREELIKANERLIVKQDAFLQSLDRQAATMGRSAAAMRAYKAEQLGLTDSKTFQNLNGQIADLENSGPSSIDKMATRMEARVGTMVLRMGVHMALITGLLGGVKWVWDELTTSTQKWLDMGNKAIETGANESKAIGGIVKAMNDELSARDGVVKSSTDLNQSAERQNVLRAEMMAQGPEYRNALVGENGLWSDQLIILKQINAEKLKATEEQIARMQKSENKPGGSWKVASGVAAAGSLGGLGSMLVNSGLQDDVEAGNKYNDELNKLFKARAALIRADAELNGAYDKKDNGGGGSQKTQYGNELVRLQEQLNGVTMSAREAYAARLRLMDDGAAGSIDKAMALYDQISWVAKQNRDDHRASAFLTVQGSEGDAAGAGLGIGAKVEQLRSIDDLMEKRQALRKEYSLDQAALRAEGEAENEVLNLVQPGRDQLMKLGDAYEKLVWARDQNKISQEQFLFGEAELLRRTAENIPVMTDLFGNLRNTITDWSKSSTNAFVDFCFTGKNSFSDLVTSMLRDLAKLAVQRNVMGPLFNGLFNGNWFSSSTGAAAGDGSGSGLFGGATGGSSFYGGGAANPLGAEISSSIVVNVNNSTGETSSKAIGASDLSQQIERAVTVVLIKNQRSGGLLSAGA